MIESQNRQTNPAGQGCLAVAAEGGRDSCACSTEDQLLLANMSMSFRSQCIRSRPAQLATLGFHDTRFHAQSGLFHWFHWVPERGLFHWFHWVPEGGLFHWFHWVPEGARPLASEAKRANSL
jgi:hypothetical protein